MTDKELQVFVTVGDQVLTGKLTLAGQETLLTVHAKEPVVTLPGYLECECQNGQKASLLDCVSYGGGHSSHYKNVIYSAQTFPHVVVLGPHHCNAIASSVESFSFHLSDAEQLFFDIEPWIQGSRYVHDADQHTYTKTFSFSGPDVIFEAVTDIGEVSAYHAPSFTGPSMLGFSAKNQVLVSIKPPSPISIEDLINLIYRFKHFAEVCTGQFQGIDEISFISTEKMEGGSPISMEVIISHSEGGSSRDRHANGYDMLAAPCLNRKDFEALVVRWFDGNDDRRRVALSRFSSNIKSESYYDANRLVSAASLFEWFSPSKKVKVPVNIAFVIKQTKTALLALPESEIQKRLLSFLGNTGSETLQQKMLRQLDDVLEILGEYTALDRQKVERVIAFAVKCRNALVHGVRDKKVVRVLDSHQIFLTETLEILFACMCLHTYGWEIRRKDDRHLRGHTRYCNFFHDFNTLVEQLFSDIDERRP